MRNIKLTIEYDGTNYAGWQKQKKVITIQQKIEEAIELIINNKVKVIGSSRTDAGVHARGFVANFMTESNINTKSFKDAINSKLPRDIVILGSEEVDMEFHSRYSSIGKRYSYTILNRHEPTALERNYVYHYKKQLDFQAMEAASSYFIGVHDFSAFKAAGSSVKTTVRNIKSAYLQKNEDKITFYIEGDGFLYNMVRIMTGTLIDVGIHKLKPYEISNIIKSKDRIKAGKTAPASGLCLEVVYY
jgi:pseudouridylate synthase I